MVHQLRVLLVFCMLTSSWAVDVNVVAQMAELAGAATMAAEAASSVAETVGSKSMSSGTEAATKVLKNPDVLTGEDATSFMSWKLTLETWMAYGDDRFSDLLSNVEMTKTL